MINIEKEAQINEEIDRLRHAATAALMTGWRAVGASVAWREPERRNTEASTANTVNRLMKIV